jgi:RNA-directed DNA polymerase
LLESIRERLAGFELELHPEKTTLAYSKNWKREEKHEHKIFTFLSYSFQPLIKPNRFGRHDKFTVFSPAICCKAKTFIREKIRAVFNPRNTQVSLAPIAAKLNSKIRGRLNYYSRFEKRVAAGIFLYLNELIRKRVAGKFRLRNMKEVMMKYLGIMQSNNALFVHWQKGVKY